MLIRLQNKLYQLLRWSEKYTKTDMIYLTRGSFWIFLMQASSSISAFVLSIIFANFLTKEVYGSYKYVLSIFSIVTIFSLSGMGVSITREISLGNRGLIYPALIERIKYGLLGSIFSLVLSFYYIYSGNNQLGISLFLISLFIPFLDPFNLYETIYYGKSDFRTPNLYSVVNQVISLILMSINAYHYPNSLPLILLSYFVPWTIGRGLMTWISIRKDIGDKKVDQDTTNRSISYGKHLTLINSVGTIANFIDKIIIFNIIGPSYLATYSIAIAPIDQVKSLFSKIMTALSLTKYSSKDRDSVIQHALVWTFKIILMVIPMIFFYFLATPFLFKLLFPKYPESIFYSRVYSLSLLLLPLYLLQSAFNSFQDKKILYIANSTTSVIQITLIFAFGYLWGITGIIGAILTAKSIQITLYLFYLKQK